MRTIYNLDDVHKYMPDGYHDICIEISGYCNARCKYCPSGEKNSEKRRGMMDAVTFRQIIVKLKELKIIGCNSHINLFWWGEPFLNPNLKEIIRVTQELGVPYILSTNAYHYRQLDADDLSNIKRLIISMPGFSQRSYDKIHQFDFEVIKNNIRKYIKDFEEAGKKDKIWMAYHVYQFNLDEIYPCYQFAYENGVSFNPGYAFPLLVEERINYAKDTLSAVRYKEMTKEIVTDQLDKMIEESNRFDCVYQTRNFIVDEKGDVYSCLNMRHEEGNRCGNLFVDNINDIIANIAALEICDECIKCGVAPTDMSFKFFQNGWFQMMKIREYYEQELNDTDRLEKENVLKIILLFRDSENVEEKSEIYKDILEKMEEINYSLDKVKLLMDKWAMRPQILKESFEKYIRKEGY